MTCPIPSSSPLCSLCFSHAGLISTPPTHQPLSCPGAFARAVASGMLSSQVLPGLVPALFEVSADLAALFGTVSPAHGPIPFFAF